MHSRKKKNLPVIFGSVIIGFFIIIAIFCEQIAPYDPSVTSVNVYQRPDSLHILGYGYGQAVADGVLSTPKQAV